MFRANRFGDVLAATALLTAADQTVGQANFAENFDNLGPFQSGQLGPQSLINQGWIFRNQSEPAGTFYAWRGGPYVYNPCGYNSFGAQAGAGYLGADGHSVDQFGYVSDWAILPDIAGQRAGDQVTVWARRVSTSVETTLIELRYSPDGGTNTGSGNNGVGDFTVVLLGATPPATGWAQFAAAVPGDGRIALRYSTPFISRCSQLIGIDSVSVGSPPPPCADFPALPQAGQTVVWNIAGSPYRICADVLIPAGATVQIDPGVVVNIDTGRTLVVEGTLRAHGSAAARITFTGPDQSARIRVFGATELDWTDINCRVEPQDGGGSIEMRDCTIRADLAGALTVFGLPTYLWSNPPLVRLDRCQVIGDGVAGYDFLLGVCHAALRGVTFDRINPSIGGYVLVDGITSTDSPHAGLSVGMTQGVLIDNVSVTGAADAGLALSGDCLIGPNTVIQGNLLPIQTPGGVRRGSSVPQTGNTRNHILTLLYDQGSILPDLGIPYVFDRDSGCVVSWPNIDPGVTIEMTPSALICSEGGRVLVKGLPASPITFRRHDPSQAWNKILVGGFRGSHVEGCVIEGATVGIGAQLGAVTLVDCTIRDNVDGAAAFLGAFGGGYIRAHKTRFINNSLAGVVVYPESTAIVNSPSLPSSFEGNGLGVESLSLTTATADARSCWWGHATGPTHPDNPGGLGDGIGGDGASAVQFSPFQPSAPDHADHPPVVRLSHQNYIPDCVTHELFEPGSKVVIEWSAQDDGQIVEQHLLFSPRFNVYDDIFEHVATLPPSQRRFEWTVPDIGFNFETAWSFLRVVAVDQAGQRGWDEIRMIIPSGDIAAALSITSDFGGQTFRSGQTLPPITWTSDQAFFGTPTFYILLEGDERSVYLGGGGGGTWNSTDSPFVSTDTARLAIVLQSTYNIQKWFFGDYFSLRPDSRIGDQPPVVQLTAPVAGQLFPGGGVVPITWTASDDEALSSFNIHASYDAGRTWHIIARDLPAAARSFDWRLPPSTGIADVRIRVVARDRRFQNSCSRTAAGDLTIGITPGQGCPADFNGDGSVGVPDIFAFLGAWFAGDASADVDGTPGLGVPDILVFLAAWFAPCP